MAWGDMQHFHESTATLNPWFPKQVRPAVGILLVAIEITLGAALLIAFHTRWAARVSEPPFDCGSVSKAPGWLVQTLTERGKRTLDAREVFERISRDRSRAANRVQ